MDVFAQTMRVVVDNRLVKVWRNFDGASTSCASQKMGEGEGQVQFDRSASIALFIELLVGKCIQIEIIESSLCWRMFNADRTFLGVWEKWPQQMGLFGSVGRVFGLPAKTTYYAPKSKGLQHQSRR